MNQHPESQSQNLLLVGRVLRAHGVRGELKVVPEADDPARLEVLSTLYLGTDADRAQPHEVEAVRPQHTKRGTLALVKLRGIDTREAAEALRRRLVFAPEADLPPLETGEAFIHDLVGLDVVTTDGAPVGTVEDVWSGPAHAVYVVARDAKEPAMIPAVEEFVAEVDLEANRLVIRPIEGLLD